MQIRTIITHFGLKKADGHVITVLRFGGIFGILSVKQHSAIKIVPTKKGCVFDAAFFVECQPKILISRNSVKLK